MQTVLISDLRYWAKMKESTTVSELAYRWLKESLGVFNEETLGVYRGLLENHVLPVFGEKDSVSQEEVSAFLEEKISQGMSESTAYSMVRVLHRILEYGASAGECQKPGWDSGLGTPKRKRGVYILSAVEERQLCSFLIENPSPMHLCIFLILTCGIGIGEVMGIQWKDVSIKNNYIRVNVSRGPVTGRKNATRKVPIGERQKIYLRKMAVGDPGAFLNSGTQKSRQRAAIEQRWRKVVDELLLERISLMELRHTYVVRCIEAGMDYESLSRRIGVENGGAFRRFYRGLVSEEDAQRLEREHVAGRKPRKVPEHTAHLGPDAYPEVVEVRKKIEAKKAELQYVLDNLDFDLDIIKTLRNSDCVQGQAREGLYNFVEKALGPDDKDGQYLVEYLRYNMRVAAMPLRVNNVTTVQAIRRRVSHGFAKLCRRIDEINALEDTLEHLRAENESLRKQVKFLEKKGGRHA